MSKFEVDESDVQALERASMALGMAYTLNSIVQDGFMNSVAGIEKIEELAQEAEAMMRESERLKHETEENE